VVISTPHQLWGAPILLLQAAAEMTTRTWQPTVGDYLLDAGAKSVGKKRRSGARFVLIGVFLCSWLVRSVETL
jgi:hypothetical protein